jgi:hypothetical protein
MKNSLKYYPIQTPEWPKEREKVPPVMVLDAGSLARLAEPIPAQFFPENMPKEKRPKSYLDLLRLLYPEVISKFYVTDIVVYETTGYIPTGEKIQKSEIFEAVNTEIATKHPVRVANLSKMLGIGCKSDFPGIEIIHDPVSQKYMRAVQPYYEALGQAKENLRNWKPYPGGPLRATLEKKVSDCRLLIAKKKQEAGGADLGEIISAKYTLDYAIRHDTTALFFSEDGKADSMLLQNILRNVHRDSIYITEVNLPGFLSGLQKTGFLDSLGFRHGANVKVMASLANKYACSINEERPIPVIDSGKDLQHSFVGIVQSAITNGWGRRI